MLAAVSGETITVAVVVSILGPAIVGFMTTRAAHRNKLEDWARTDVLEARQLLATQEVARVAAEAAELARLAQVHVETKLIEIDTQGKVTHALVNSDMTEEKRGRLVQVRATLAALKRIVAADEREGIAPTEEDLDAIKALVVQITHLEGEIKARVEQQAKIDASASVTVGVVKKQVIEAVADKLTEDIGEPPDPAVTAVADKLTTEAVKE